MPAGLTLTTDGQFSGTPTETGAFPLTINVADSAKPPATASVQLTLTVYGQWGPYDTPAAVTICQVDLTNPAVPVIAMDAALKGPRCFNVSEPLAESIVKYMLTQKQGLDANGNTLYTYASWWDYLLQSYVTTSVYPLLDQFPPASVAQAQQNAAAAAAAVAAAKAAAAGLTTGQ
jgi:hypothetical protein